MDSASYATDRPLIQIIGAGQMGAGIGQVCALHGYNVHFVDPSRKACENAISRIQSALTKQYFTPHIVYVDDESPEIDTVQPCITYSNTLNMHRTHWIIEAAPEDFSLKQTVWSSIRSQVEALHNQQPVTFERHPFYETYYASNTSSYSISKIATFAPNSHRFIGLHFMNPAHKIPLLEIIRGHATQESTYNAALQFAKSLHKTPVTVADTPGFVVNRVLIPMINEAICVLEEGTATAHDIDHAMTLGAAHPMGPLKLADLIGLDTCLAILQDLHERLNHEKYKPSQLLIQNVQSGYLGKKSGQGFYHYS